MIKENNGMFYGNVNEYLLLRVPEVKDEIEAINKHWTESNKNSKFALKEKFEDIWVTHEELVLNKNWEEQNYYPNIVPPHVFYGDVLNEFVFKLLEENKEKELLQRIFAFYEEMAICGDDNVENVLQVTLLEYLWDDFTVLTRAYRYMHPKTKKLCDELQYYFNPFTPVKLPEDEE